MTTIGLAKKRWIPCQADDINECAFSHRNAGQPAFNQNWMPQQSDLVITSSLYSI